MTTEANKSGIRLKGIRVYPLKGAGGFDLVETGLDRLGIPGDRRWMLVRPDGLFISQRTHPRLALVQVSHPVPEGSYSVRIPGEPLFSLGPPRSPEWMDVQVHEDRIRAQGGYRNLDRSFSTFLGEPCRLVFLPDETLRPVDPDWAPGHQVSFADAFPLLITKEESLADLNLRLETPLSMLRFRPNLVLGGGGPWEEDRWREVGMGGARMELVRPCARCSVVLVDPETGAPGGEPLRTLDVFRRWEGKIYFGQNAVLAEPGRLRVGDDVHVLKEGDSRPPLSPDPPRPA